MASVNLRHSLTFAALCGLACSELAGFEELRGDEDTPNGGDAGDDTRGGASGTGAGGSGASAGDVEPGGGEPGSSGTGGSAAGTGGGQGGRADGGAGSGAAGSGKGGASGSGGSAGTTGGANGGTGGTVTPGACGEQLLANADFESGATLWRHETTWPGIDALTDVIVPRTDSRLASASFTPPPSGSYVGWLGGIPDSGSIYRIGLLQDLVIPEETTSIVLSGQIQIKTEEDQSAEYDRLTMSLEDELNAWEFDNNPDPGSLVFTNEHPTTGWIAFSSTMDQSSYIMALRGRAVYLRLESRTDEGSVTSFWVDSLRLVAECER